MSLADALAEVGRQIEALPPHECKPQVDTFLEPLTEQERRDFVTGVFLHAHELRTGLKAGRLVLADHSLLEALVDNGDCSFDHHGGCQEHGYLVLEPGELCPQRELKDLLAEAGR